MVLATMLLPASAFVPEFAMPLGWAAVACGGVGTAFVILLWSELYGCLNPFRVALYYSGSLVVAAAVIYLSRSMDFAAFFAVTTALPLFSLGMVAAGFRSLPAERLPRSEAAPFAIPWRVIVIMGVYAFAYGLKETDLYQSTFGPHSSFGVVVVAALIFLLVVVRGRRFQFSLIFRVALLLAVCAFLVVPSIGDWGAFVTDFCIGASYTAFSIFVMVVMANFCYRYGASAVLLFGIERGLRALVMLAGRHTDRFLHQSFEAATGDMVLSAIVIVAVVVATMMLLSDRDLAGRWGLALPGMGSVEDAHAETARDELVDRCSKAAQRFGLSQREEEVLRLLAQHKKIGSIEQELFISNNTAKTHIRHIYRKLDVHSRDELVALLEELD
ncbi:MAG TPA: helix-turn-helix transcriptional regulator [Candidatus Aveggerthella excrementigallinarum]|nr:helix-turn-helix transcriptional regulator [Candidatus Aveggerthella excrementigallinarum]